MVVKMQGNWKPMIKVPETIPSASFLVDERFLKEYNSKVDADFKGNKALKVFEYSDGFVKGSNPFVVALVGEMVRPLGFDVATPAQLEQILATDALPLEGQYEDSALVLRSADNSNKYLAADLAKQVKARGMKLRNPIVMPLTGLQVVNDANSEYGLAFKLGENAQLIEAPQLAGKNHGKNFSSTDANGLPAGFKKNGSRTLYAQDKGLSWLFLGRGLDLYSNSDNLAGSYDFGRVVLVRDAVAGADLMKEYSSKLEQTYASAKSELEERFGKAKKVLMGEGNGK